MIPKTKEQFFPVVGIGASAGGLDAFKKFVQAIQEKSGMAYIFIQHMNPEHNSLLTEILSKSTKIPVQEISNTLQFEQNHIYVMPPDKLLSFSDGALILVNRTNKNKHIKPIDLFFSSIGIIYQSFAMGIVLSGSADDGTEGLGIIKQNGGITFAQDEASAAFEGMPHSAISSGNVDFILPPQKMPAKLIEINNSFNIVETKGIQEINVDEQSRIYKQMLAVVRVRKNVDFTFYKQTTIKRRIIRRMALTGLEKPQDYLNLLRENVNEQDALYADLLISVTNFFRDTKSFDTICDTIIPGLIKENTVGEPIRIWVAGCATGEEAYSFAICLQEEILKEKIPVKIQIFATDISEKAIIKARSGTYTATELDGVSPQRLERFFVKLNDSYQVNKSLREMCVFAHHNIIKDPPFARMDIISCRNVLIYMELVLQKKIFSIFHYALKPKGLLILGKSETIGSNSELFNQYTKLDKIYTRKGAAGKYMQVESVQSEDNFKKAENNFHSMQPVSIDYQKTADQIVLSGYAPPGVIVNEQFDIVQFRGATGSYLEPVPGKPTHNLIRMAKEGLGFELRNILHKAQSTNASSKKKIYRYMLTAIPSLLLLKPCLCPAAQINIF